MDTATSFRVKVATTVFQDIFLYARQKGTLDLKIVFAVLDLFDRHKNLLTANEFSLLLFTDAIFGDLDLSNINVSDNTYVSKVLAKALNAIVVHTGMTCHSFLTSLIELIPMPIDTSETVAAFASAFKKHLHIFQLFWTILPFADLPAGFVPCLPSVFLEIKTALFASLQSYNLHTRDFSLPSDTDNSGQKVPESDQWIAFIDKIQKRLLEYGHLKLSGKIAKSSSVSSVIAHTTGSPSHMTQAPSGPRIAKSPFLLRRPLSAHSPTASTSSAHTPAFTVAQDSNDSPKKYSESEVHHILTEFSKRQRISSSRDPYRYSHESDTPSPTLNHANNICRNSLRGLHCHTYPCPFEHPHGQAIPVDLLTECDAQDHH